MYPNITINIINDLTDNLIKKLRNGDIDILIISMNNNDSIKDLDITTITELHDIFVGNINILQNNMTLHKAMNKKLLFLTPNLLSSQFS
jgi:hypothetical protein